MSDKGYLKRELRNLLKSMDYIADNYLYKTKARRKYIETFFRIYQQLGLLWEFLGLQCRHWDGYKKKGDKFICKICGKIKGLEERYYLLPVRGDKIIGKMIRPGESNKTLPTRKEAEIVNDKIIFHGAKLKVEVYKSYVSRLGKEKINIAADRMVTLNEGGLVIDISKYITGIRIKKVKGAQVYGGFVWELSKPILKKAPVILSYTKGNKLAEIELLT